MDPTLSGCEGVRTSLRRRLAATRDQSAFVLVFSALFMTVMIALGGMAVDIGNWYLHVQRLQRGADSAALAGSIYMPNDFSSAKTIAGRDLTQNGLASGVSSEIVQSQLHPTQIKVSVSERVPSYFISLIGVKSFTFTRSAIAEYRPYVPMGSPSNLLGQEPSTGDSWEKSQDQGLQDHYWLNIAGAGTSKANGDRYSGGLCDSSTDGCNTSITAPNGNQDYNPLGQTYIVRVASGTSGTIAIQAFDPEFAYVGDTCDASTIKDGTNTQYNSSTNTGMYTWGNDNPYCTGDQQTDTSKSAPSTTFQLYTPDLSAGGSKPISTAGCTSQTYPGYKTNIANLINTNTSFKATYRKWTTICTLYVGSQYPPGDYLLHVSTGTNTSYNGLNRFALRAAVLTSAGTVDASATQGVSLFSQGRLVIYAHDTTGDVTFFVAQVHSGSAGENLNVTLFDIGDADGGANLSFLPPSDAKVGTNALTTFTNCKYSPPGSSTYQSMASGCSINGISSGSYNGRIVNLRVPIPSNYSCDDVSPDGCWTRLKLHYGAGTVQDTTSWEVSLDGNPVRLLPNSTATS